MTTIPTTLLLLLAVRPSATPAPAGLSVAVFDLEARTGVTGETAALLTGEVVEQVRAARVFSKVVSTKEIESLLNLERQRQVMDCEQTSCMSEIAGALGVDLVLVGALGKLGNAYVLQLRLLSTKTATVAASISSTQCGDSDQTLLMAVGPAVRRLLFSAGYTAVGDPGALATRCGEQGRGDTASVPAPSRETGARPLVTRLLGAVAGGAGAVTLLPAGLLLLGAVLGGVTLFSPDLLSVARTPGVAGTPRFVLLRVLPASLAVAGALLVLGAVGLGGTGVLLGVASVAGG